MEGRNELLLINYLDRTLEEKEMRDMEALINSDPETRKQWQYLQLAVEAVEYAALYDQVAAVKENFKTIQQVDVSTASPKRGLRVRMNVFRVAAGLLLFIVGAGAYKYFTTSATQLYQQTFIEYTLPTTRGQASITGMEQAYRLQHWNDVIAALNNSSLTDNKALFLAGMAHLQLHNYAEANMLFEQVRANNIQMGDDYFQDEAEFYGALCYLAFNKTKEAIILLQQIRSNTNHLYQAQASRIGKIDWQILKIKGDR
ncbi:MAG TPA: hypothetical protein VF008_07380 [Niastella sp.]